MRRARRERGRNLNVSVAEEGDVMGGRRDDFLDEAFW